MWLAIILIVAVALGLLYWMRSKNIKFNWYEWLIGVVGLLMLLFAVQNFFGTSAELEEEAANLFLLVVGLPGLILMVVSWQLAARRQRAQA